MFASSARLPRLVRRLSGISVALILGACGAATAAGSTSSPPTCPPKPAAAKSGPSAGTELVPPGASRVLLCRYHFDALKGHGVITHASTIRKLTREFDALRAVPSGTYSCPADFGVLVSARFTYRRDGADYVLADESGCTIVSNGRVKRWATHPPGPELLRRLLRDTGCRGREPGSACA